MSCDIVILNVIVQTGDIVVISLHD